MARSLDAPLDEGNVGRFSQLVRDMSEKVQFIVVTHNKATMERTTQFCGLTMREPGASRLVQVDLDEAAKQIAGASAEAQKLADLRYVSGLIAATARGE